jgi:transcriptional regulator with XRE-family HTH domain
MEVFKALFGRKLNELLKERGIKQYELASLIGIEAPNVSRWVNGVTFPDEAHFKKICEKLSVSPNYFTDAHARAKSEILGRLMEVLPALNETQLSDILANITGGKNPVLK